MSETPVRILHLEDCAADAELVASELANAGVRAEVRHVTDERAYLEELSGSVPDLILSDCWMVGTDAGTALSHALRLCPEIPFIFVSGTIEEEFALECVKRGATDYVFKDRLQRLAPAVRRALKEARERAERRCVERELKDREERHALVLRASKEGVLDWDLKEGRMFYSERWSTMLGVDRGELGDTPEGWFGRVHPDDLSRLKSQIDQYLKGVTPHLESEHRLRRKDDAYRWVQVRGLALRDAKGTAFRLVGAVTDVTERKRTEEQLRRNAFYDDLTGLPNRALFMDRLGSVMRKTGRRKDLGYAVLLVALDRLKEINDSFGRRAGDAVLLEVSERLRKCLRAGDSLARLESDVYSILADDLKAMTDSGLVADRVRKALEAPVQLGSSQIFVTVGMGMALGEARYDRPADVVEDAEVALSRAKSRGRSGYQVFEADMHEKARKALDLERDLRRALQKGYIVPYFQPLFLLADGRLCGAEALARWVDASKGVVSPGSFLPVAEKSGLMPELDGYVLRAVAAQITNWKKAGLRPVAVSVNCSARTLQARDVPGLVKSALTDYGLAPELLRIELTESDVMESAETALAKLRGIAAEGVQIYLDDFGTGYSSLSYLRKFPLSALKIDRSFVDGLEKDPGAATLSDAIVSMAHRLGLRVVAEGIETEKQAQMLREMGCEEAQGYFFGKPVPAGEFAKLLERGGE